MMKGLNRNVIELNCPDSRYFERAVLILRNDCADINDSEFIEESERTILRNSPPSFISASKAHFILANLISGTAGALIAAVIFVIIKGFV